MILCANCRQRYLKPQNPRLYYFGLEHVQCPCGGWTSHCMGVDITREQFAKWVNTKIEMEKDNHHEYGKPGVY